MKKLIRNIILITFIINSCICIVYNTYNYIQSEKTLDYIATETMNSKKMQTLKISIEEGKELDDFLEERQVLGRRYILANNLVITIISFIISLGISAGIFFYENLYVEKALRR